MIEIQSLFTQALTNDQKVDAQEFEGIRQAILKDQTVDEMEKNFLIDKLAESVFDKGAIPGVAVLIAKAGEVKKEEKPEEKKKSNWKTEFAVQGNFNHTQVSSGWTGQYGQEVTSTKIEGSFEIKADYDTKKHAWKNKLLLEYGNVFVKGEEARVISKNNLEFTSEVSHKLYQKGNFGIEVPYLAFYTKGPVTELEGRKLRETTGAKLTYKNGEHSQYSLKLGGGIQHTADENREWVHEPGVEAVAEVKQGFGFLQKPLANALKTEETTIAFLGRMEANAEVNAFNSMKTDVSISNTDVRIKTGLKYYLSDKKNIWLGVGKQWEYGGQAESSWEHKFTTDIGFKF